MTALRKPRKLRAVGQVRRTPILPLPPAWVTDAVCAQVDPELFFPELGQNCQDAKRLCASCPVQPECLAYALANRELYGIWGGTSTKERVVLRRQLRHNQERRAA